MKIFPPHKIDFYKSGHIFQYPDGTEYVFANFTPRSFHYSILNRLPIEEQKVVWFGLQGVMKWFLNDCWNDEFFKKPKKEVLAKIKRRMDTSLGEGSVTIDHFEKLYDLGYLPIKITALAEGSRVPKGIPVFTIINTLPEFYWLPNYLETSLSALLWKSSTVATIAYQYRKLFLKYAEETGAPKEFVDWQGHDFSARGMSSIYDFSQNGAGHLLSFLGTDTVSAIDYVEDYYNESGFIGGSVPATEHSVMMAGGKLDEYETIKRLITEVYPSGIVSVVSDTWDFWNVITVTASRLKDEILNRKPNPLGMAKVVFRPDSGDPVKIVSGYKIFNLDKKPDVWYYDLYVDGYEVVIKDGKYYLIEFDYDRYDCGVNGFIIGKEISEAEAKGAIECLWNIFSGTKTEKGYKILNERVGLIYGDSITYERAEQILKRLEEKGFASCNCVFGIGSYTYQYNTRDTFGWAMKSTAACINGQWNEMFKDPKTDSGTKKSAKGFLKVKKVDGEFVLLDQQKEFDLNMSDNELRVVYKDGRLYNEESFTTIKERLHNV